MRIASRYFATVRRAISMPAARNFSTMVSSESTSCALSTSMSCLMRCRTASAEWASPPSADAIAALVLGGPDAALVKQFGPERFR